MRVYISATYADLIEHRAAVAHVLRQMGHEVVGMEEYVAEGLQPLDRCLADAASADVCVSILAWRYGHVPAILQAGAALLPSGAIPGVTSITECEFRAAVPKKPLVFVLDPTASWPAPFVDALTGDNEAGARIKSFRDEALNNWLAGIFRTPEDLARQVGAAIYRREIEVRVGAISMAFESGFAESLMGGGPIRDSTLISMKRSLAAAPQLAVLRLDLRDGQYWWSTRLFFLARLTEELAATHLLIFLEEGKRFVGASTPATVRDRLARGEPFLRKYEEYCRKRPVDSRNVDRALDQRAAAWDNLFAEQSEEDTRILVSARELRRWLGPDLLQRGVEQASKSLAPAFLRSLLDWPHSYVPVTANGNLEMVVNRVAIAEQLARMFVTDLERAPGVFVSPAMPTPKSREVNQSTL